MVKTLLMTLNWNDSIDSPKYLKHVPRWHGNKTPPACDIHFLGDEFSLSPDNINTCKPLNYFKLFWKDELHELLSEQTNLYSFQTKSKSINSSPGEIEQFIGIHMFMFIITLPAFYMYWETMKVKQDTHLLQISCQLLDTKRYVRTFKLVTIQNAMIQKTKRTNFIKYNLF